MVITDIKNTKIKVENEEYAREIHNHISENGNGYYFQGEFEPNSMHYYVCHDKCIVQVVDPFEGDDLFKGWDKKEIWFYSGEFHDKPQDELEKGLEKLSALGYEYHNGEWLSKEEIEKQERLEAAYDLYCAWNIHKESRFCFNVWKEEVEFTGKWLRVVDKTGYRKGEL